MSMSSSLYSHLSLSSTFELLLTPISNPKQPLKTHRPHNRPFSAHRPLNHLHAHLTQSSILTLRLVSYTTKSYIDSLTPCPFSSLYLTLPPTATNRPPSLSALRRLPQSCTHLKTTIISIPSTPSTANSTPTFPIAKLLALLPTLTNLHISTPSSPVHSTTATAATSSQHQTLLSLRQALESASHSLPHLTTLTLDPITIAGLLSLRSGAFSSFDDADWAKGKFWHGIKTLELGMVRFWDQGPNRRENGDGQETRNARTEKEKMRMGFKILHDFLATLAPTVEVLRWEWLDPSPGLTSPSLEMVPGSNFNHPNPNPLLLDLEVVRMGIRERKGQAKEKEMMTEEINVAKWFSAPGIEWKGLRVVWFCGFEIAEVDLRGLKERARGLKKVILGEVGGKEDDAEYGDGDEGFREEREWVEIDMEGDGDEILGDIEITGARALHGDDGGDWYEMHAEDGEGGWDEDGRSMEVPLMLDRGIR